MVLKKLALLIGVNNYPLMDDLKYAERDATAFSESLQCHYGFQKDEIVLMTSVTSGAKLATQRFIERQFQHLREIHHGLGLLLIGFWGHGFQQNNKRYLSATDTDYKDLLRTGISLDSLLSTVSQSGAQNTCIILDCCQQDTGRGYLAELTDIEESSFTRDMEITARDIAAVRRKRDTILQGSPSVAILNSCSAGQRAFEWEDRQHGIFTAHLLDAMSNRMAGVSQLAGYVSQRVPLTAYQFSKTQVPYFKLEGGGDIELLPAGQPHSPPQSSPVHVPKPQPKPKVEVVAPSIELKSERLESTDDLAALCTRVDALEKEYVELLKDYTEVSPKVRAHLAAMTQSLDDIRVAYPLAIERKQSEHRHLLEVEGMRPDSQKAKGLESEIMELTKRYRHYSRSTEERLSGLFCHGNSAGERMVLPLKGIEYAFRWCPPGKFMMGSPSNEADRYNNETQHQVTLTKGFWMLETQVTQGMWQSVMGSNPSHFKGDTRLPVEQVSWNDCQSFISQLNELLRDSTQRASNVSWRVSLPTEAQWEYACRAGTTGPYGGTGVLDAMGWYDNNSSSKPHPVGLKNPNAWGLYDMHGNVWEWCLDWYGDYPSDALTDPTGPNGGTNRVNRGGGWSNYARNCRSADRDNNSPGGRFSYLGFRPCLISLVP